MHCMLLQQQLSVATGIPAYNGEKYLRDDLINILEQIYQDSGVVISDNASTLPSLPTGQATFLKPCCSNA